MRTHKVSRIEVCCDESILVQTKQYIKSTGNYRLRNFLNISETMEGDEQPLETAIRGLYEELNLDIDSSRLIFIEHKEEVKPSPSSGKIKRYLFWDYKLQISKEEKEFIPLAVDEGDTINYFNWRSLNL